MASFTSSALPTWVPKGWSMPLTSATMGLPASTPTRTMFSASLRLSSRVCIIAPEPVFTSRTMASLPAASFLLRIEETIRGRESTVEVTSRRL